MGGRGGGNPWGSPSKLYLWKFHTIIDGIVVNTANSMLSTGGSPPAWFVKEVGSGIVPTINWYQNSRGIYFSPANGGIYNVSNNKILFSTTNSSNNYNLEYGNFTKTEYPNTNNHPIIYQ
jgi:hypothetical protein